MRIDLHLVQGCYLKPGRVGGEVDEGAGRRCVENELHVSRPGGLDPTPDTVPAGIVTHVGQNLGWRTHELVILPLGAGAVAGQPLPGADGKVDEYDSLGEASASCVQGTGNGIAAGTAGWITLTQKHGRYELVCNLKNHYADGMHHELDVR